MGRLRTCAAQRKGKGGKIVCNHYEGGYHCAEWKTGEKSGKKRCKRYEPGAKEKVRKRESSEWNKFVSRYSKDHPDLKGGDLFRAAASAYRSLLEASSV
jgi:hypothetical protein